MTIQGVVPVAPTVFTESEDVDVHGQRRAVDFMVEAGSDGICALANYGEQFSLTDDERDGLVEAIIDQVAGRVPVFVTTSHYSARIAAERSRRAQEQGASVVMLMPPFFGATVRVDEEAVLDYFKQVADAVDLPIMVQDAPMSPTPMSASLLVRLAREIPHVQYVKIEVQQAADKLALLAEGAGADLPGLFDGEEAVTLVPDLHAGAVGTMSSAMIPDKLGPIVHAFLAGKRDEASELWEDVLPLIQFENRQCGMRATKALMLEGGIIGSDRSRSPMAPLRPATRRQLVDLARRKEALILRWAS